MKDTEERKFLLAFGKHLAKLRKARGHTQAELAEKIGVSHLSLAYFETGRRWPRPVTLKKIAKGLKVSVADLFQGL